MDQPQRPWVTRPEKSDLRSVWRPDLGLFEDRGLDPDALDSALIVALHDAGFGLPEDLAHWRETLFLEARRRLFPRRFPAGDAAVAPVAQLFFPLALAVVEEQWRRGGSELGRILPFCPLAETETLTWASAGEYRCLLGHLEGEGYVACLAMAQQWRGLTIFDHVLGVTGLTLWMGRQLARSVPVDLPLLHGGSIGHDVGKFGCVGDEERRIPRLHYYYTHLYYQQRNLPGLGHLATNHSCWDLELRRLPVESQLLIYADFRSREITLPDGRRRMAIVSLSESYQSILNKLENVDGAKIERYQRVFRKLKDLEEWALALGVDLDPPGISTGPCEQPDLPEGLDVNALMGGRERADSVALAVGGQIRTTARFLTTAHTVGVMERLRDLPALRALLEEARSFEGWRDLRTYLGVLGEFAPALSMEQREQTLGFFFELLDHRDDDIRYHAANRIGDLLALGDESWRKDLPEGVAEGEHSWVGRNLDRVLGLLDRAGESAAVDMDPVEQVCYAVPLILRRLASRAEPAARAGLLDSVLESLEGRVGDPRPLVGLYMCESLEVLLPFLIGPQRDRALHLALAFFAAPTDNTRLMARRVVLALGDSVGRESDKERVIAALTGSGVVSGIATSIAEIYLTARLAAHWGVAPLAAACRQQLANPRSARRQVMLRNLKTQVGWVVKKVNCDYLIDTALGRVGSGEDPDAHFAYEVAFHLTNLLKVSRVEGTRFHAGRSLLRLLPVLSDTQRNDLAVELVRSLQLDVEAVTRYIPRFLGPLIASLPEQEFLEVVADIDEHVRSGAEPLQRLLLQTVGTLIESAGVAQLGPQVLSRLAGMLLGALADTRTSTVHEGYAQFAMLFERLSGDAAQRRKTIGLLQLVAKKLLSLLSHAVGDRGRYFLIAQCLNHLVKALDVAGSAVRFSARPSVALLAGTHDPFTVAHAEIVTEAARVADEVLIQIDDYSWRKHAQPRQVRKELARMALASIPNAFLAPFEPPVNLMDRHGLATLRRRLRGRRLWLIAGTDVIENASAYRHSAGHLWNVRHVLIRRDEGSQGSWRERLPWFRNSIRIVELSPAVRGVSSTSVRAALDRRQDPSATCAPLVARTLLERQLYLNYPCRKVTLNPPPIGLRSAPAAAEAPHGLATISAESGSLVPVRWRGRRHEWSVLDLNGEPTAAVRWREVAAVELGVLLPDAPLDEIEDLRSGHGAIVDRVVALPGIRGEHGCEMVFDRLMQVWLDAGLSFAIVPVSSSGRSTIVQLLLGRGAQTVEQDGRPRLVILPLNRPVVVVQDLEHVLQKQFLGDEHIVALIRANRNELAAFLAERAGGGVVVPLHEPSLRREVAAWAGQLVSRTRHTGGSTVMLGLGAQFSRDLIGDCPTLALGVERFLTWEGHEAGFHPSTGSPSLELQIDTARELGREALLLVPFLDEITAVLQVVTACRAAGLTLREVLVGATSAALHARLHREEIRHRCGIVIPAWQGVVRESAVTPYVGGWTIVERDPLTVGALLPSLNDCLPYHDPHFFGFDRSSSLDFSRLVLGHGRNLMAALEQSFRHHEGRLLGLQDLGAVVRIPRCPPFPRGFVPARDRVCSELLEEDAGALARLHPETHAAHQILRRGM